jgi:Sodium / potassium ATPase beta chain
MPTDLVEYIKKLPVPQRRQIWVSCHGENPHDTENVGPIEYVGTRGFPEFFYPFLNQPGYLSPLVPIRLSRPAGKLSFNFFSSRIFHFFTPIQSTDSSMWSVEPGPKISNTMVGHANAKVPCTSKS